MTSLAEADQVREALEVKLRDRDWRLNNLYWILTKDGKKVRFRPNWAQVELFDNMERKNLVLKVRQVGITTGYCILWLDSCLFTANLRVGIVAHTKDDAQIIFRDKVKFAYDNLPEDIKALRPADKNDAGELVLTNGSGIRVAVSFRSGTVQALHVTEYGTICAKYPQRAEEVKTGALQAVADDCIVVIESTAKGRVGHFYDLVQEAQKREARPSKYDWHLRFMPWWKNPEYTLDDPGFVPVEAELVYLQELEGKIGQKLTKGQRTWWARKQRDLGEDIYAEYPSTPDEAFRQTAEGAYYGKLMMTAWREGRIARVPIEPALPVDTWWDIGRDTTAIWFKQEFGREVRLVNYYANSGEGLPHYAKYLQDFQKEHRIMWGRHVFPHDMKIKEWAANETRIKRASELGIEVELAPGLPDVTLEDGIEAVRALLPRCIFDEERCSKGVAGLEHYRKEWDPMHGVWRDQPLHDWASHPADAFRGGATYQGRQIIRKGNARTRPVRRVVWNSA